MQWKRLFYRGHEIVFAGFLCTEGDNVPLEFKFEATKFEESWSRQALETFYEDGWIEQVLYRVKGGKEATVYCCKADPATGYDLLAAKIYRHRQSRSMKNYASYREGRHVTADTRQLRAIRNKSRAGKGIMDSAWIRSEYKFMRTLHDAGADVPEPVAHGPHSMLMDYVGDREFAAPILHDVRLDRSEAQPMFDRIIENVTTFLAYDLVHGDLSAFNILYWEGDFTIIDFPQAVSPTENGNAFQFLVRDVERVCQYFEKFGVQTRYFDIAEDLWHRYLRRQL